MKKMVFLDVWFESVLSDAGIAAEWISIVRLLIGLVVLILLSMTIYALTKKFIVKILHDYSDESEHLIPAKVDSCFDDDFLG